MRTYIINANLNADEAKELAKSVVVKLKKNDSNRYSNSPYPVSHLKLVK